MLELTIHDVAGVLVITCENPEPTGAAPRSSQREALYQAVQTRPDPRFAMDLGSIDYLASADIGFLIALKRRVDARQGKLVLFQMHPVLLDTLRTMKLATLFEVADDLPHALALLGNPPGR